MTALTRFDPIYRLVALNRRRAKRRAVAPIMEQYDVDEAREDEYRRTRRAA
jgi:hypothetical protein